MPRIKNSITINADVKSVFKITNDLKRWPELFEEYSSCEILSKEESNRFTKIFFKLTNNANSSWTSWRILDHNELSVIAERVDPLYPFEYMHLKWIYEPVDDGTRLTWIQDFEADKNFKEFTLEQAVANMNNHTRINQERIKEIIEKDNIYNPINNVHLTIDNN